MRPRPWLLLGTLLAACSSKAAGTTGGAGTGAGTTGTGAASSSTSSGATSSSSGSGTGGGQPGGACQSPLTEYPDGKGSVTYYTFSMGAAAVNCGFQVLG